MWGRQKKLAHLYEELRIIAVFDRLNTYAEDASVPTNGSHVSRETRQNEILAAIAKLEGKEAA